MIRVFKSKEKPNIENKERRRKIGRKNNNSRLERQKTTSVGRPNRTMKPRQTERKKRTKLRKQCRTHKTTRARERKKTLHFTTAQFHIFRFSRCLLLFLIFKHPTLREKDKLSFHLVVTCSCLNLTYDHHSESY